MKSELTDKYLDWLYTMVVQKRARKLYRGASACDDDDEGAAMRAEAVDLVIAAANHDAVFRPLSDDGSVDGCKGFDHT